MLWGRRHRRPHVASSSDVGRLTCKQEFDRFAQLDSGGTVTVAIALPARKDVALNVFVCGVAGCGRNYSRTEKRKSHVLTDHSGREDASEGRTLGSRALAQILSSGSV